MLHQVLLLLSAAGELSLHALLLACPIVVLHPWRQHLWQQHQAVPRILHRQQHLALPAARPLASVVDACCHCCCWCCRGC